MTMSAVGSQSVADRGMGFERFSVLATGTDWERPDDDRMVNDRCTHQADGRL